MLQEQKADLYSLYIYETGSYAPLARLDTDPSQPDQKPKRYYFHTDQIGTPLEVTDDTGRMVWRAYYKTWGALEALAPKEIEQNLRFQGQYYDAETGLHYNTFRYYDPVVGRYITQDPIGLIGGLNLYRYTVNALTWFDPLGWCGENINWGGHLKKIGGGEPPATMLNPHAHHIVFKNGRGKKMKEYLAESKSILEKYDIDWLFGKENLTWAPNKNHSTQAAKAVRDALVEADKIGTRESIVETLSTLGKHFADDTIHTLF
ncbi:RHS repeat-associated core domain-containing protein [Pseudomonas sp. JZ134]|uniref:RHS repeat-associated core domain-containing protein n=1 Tax=Pseudomonas sp. JZ134 TaxID=2806615 RepID=UPI003DA056EA